ncbi:unnamed protein product [Rodentolepis nana]|uniref:ERC protein 2 n=1 Tax=Rodentolepis nana TaxID=102285 RepID=A0A0R3TNP6_RODNA|nr:unnamed protein product [Rodentolepis nana]
MNSIQYASNLSSPHPNYPYAATVPQRHPERPRPSSARDPVYADLLDSLFYNQTATPQSRLQPSTTTIFDGRATSADRGSNYPVGPRGYLNSSAQRYGRSAYLPGYIIDQTTSYQPLNSCITSTQSMGNRRAQSYDVNLERQGLSEHTNAMQSTGINTNPGGYNYYGNVGSERMNGLGGGAPIMNPVMDYRNFSGVSGYSGYGTNLGGSSGLMTFQNSADVISLQCECVRLNQELEVTKEKLNACMTSIRTFWSPELKRERAMRKDENAKYAILADHLHQLQLEKQVCCNKLTHN